MSAVSTAVAVLAAAEGELVERELPVPTWAFGVMAAGLFLLLLLITYSFRSVATTR